MQVVLAIPDPGLRMAIELYLDEEPGLFLAAVATEAESIRALVRTVRPDLLLMSWELPGCSPAHLIREIRAQNDAPQIIVLSNDAALRPVALAAGAFALVLSWDPATDLIGAIRLVRPEPLTRDLGQG